MADYFVLIFNTEYFNYTSINNENIIDNYFFLNKNDTFEFSKILIEKYICTKDKEENDNKINLKNKIRNKNYYAFPFLIIKKLIESIDGKIFIFERLNINLNLW